MVLRLKRKALDISFKWRSRSIHKIWFIYSALQWMLCLHLGWTSEYHHWIVIFEIWTSKPEYSKRWVSLIENALFQTPIIYRTGPGFYKSGKRSQRPKWSLPDAFWATHYTELHSSTKQLQTDYYIIWFGDNIFFSLSFELKIRSTYLVLSLSCAFIMAIVRPIRETQYPRYIWSISFVVFIQRCSQRSHNIPTEESPVHAFAYGVHHWIMFACKCLCWCCSHKRGGQ